MLFGVEGKEGDAGPGLACSGGGPAAREPAPEFRGAGKTEERCTSFVFSMFSLYHVIFNFCHTKQHIKKTETILIMIKTIKLNIWFKQ